MVFQTTEHEKQQPKCFVMMGIRWSGGEVREERRGDTIFPTGARVVSSKYVRDEYVVVLDASR
jgi:hypothetical protein